MSDEMEQRQQTTIYPTGGSYAYVVSDTYATQQQREENARWGTQTKYAHREKIADTLAIPSALVIVVLIAAAVIVHLVRKSIAASLEIAMLPIQLTTETLGAIKDSVDAAMSDYEDAHQEARDDSE
jgi:hypothetical protein